MDKPSQATLAKTREAARLFFDARHAVEEAECPSRLAKLSEIGCGITSAGGNCPVQIEGVVRGKPFYFRARGDSWSLGIGSDWKIQKDYGTWPDAGWMPLHEAYDFLLGAITEWLDHRRNPTKRKAEKHDGR